MTPRQAPSNTQLLDHKMIPDNYYNCLSLDLIENACLKAHNNRRALHGASPLIWDDTLVKSAQVWADHLAATGKVRHDPNLNGQGENIAWFRGHNAADCMDALVGW